jgi:hypothetical protein
MLREADGQGGGATSPRPATCYYSLPQTAADCFDPSATLSRMAASKPTSQVSFYLRLSTATNNNGARLAVVS